MSHIDGYTRILPLKFSKCILYEHAVSKMFNTVTTSNNDTILYTK